MPPSSPSTASSASSSSSSSSSRPPCDLIRCERDRYRAAGRREGGAGTVIVGEGLEKRYGRERRERSGMLLERFGLWDVRADRVATYSRGMTQRLALCRALLQDPSLVVLDEPFTALDEDGAALLDRELQALTGERTVVLSTH